MIVTSFAIANYCVPCSTHCRHCLLSSCGKATGIDYETGIKFADRILKEIEEKMPDLSASFYIGYCMDTPHLTDFIRFARRHNSPAAEFLQMNGFNYRTPSSLITLWRQSRKRA